MSVQCEVHRLGLVPYDEAHSLQESLATERVAGDRPDSLLLLEHPHTYTFGRSGKAANLLLSDEALRAQGIAVRWTDRGGDVTYHGPGQLVGYPILDLGRPAAADGRVPRADYVGYLRALEAVLIHALVRCGIVSGQLPGRTGVWLQPDVASRCPHCHPDARKAPSKIASIGVKVDGRGITRHGFSLNVFPDMTFFEGIVACDLPDAPSISMAQLLGDAPDMDAVMDAVVDAFGVVFEREMVSAQSAISSVQIADIGH